jgi:hypothetical protein
MSSARRGHRRLCSVNCFARSSLHHLIKEKKNYQSILFFFYWEEIRTLELSKKFARKFANHSPTFSFAKKKTNTKRSRRPARPKTVEDIEFFFSIGAVTIREVAHQNSEQKAPAKYEPWNILIFIRSGSDPGASVGRVLRRTIRMRKRISCRSRCEA